MANVELQEYEKPSRDPAYLAYEKAGEENEATQLNVLYNELWRMFEDELTKLNIAREEVLEQFYDKDREIRYKIQEIETKLNDLEPTEEPTLELDPEL